MPYYPSRPEERPPDPPQRRRTLLRRVLLCASFLLIAYGVVRLINYGADLLSLRRTTEALREIAAEPAFTEIPDSAVESPAEAISAETVSPKVISSQAVSAQDPPVPASSSPAPAAVEEQVLSDKLPAVEYPGGFSLVPRIQKLRKKNEYVIGWITMDDLDEPVVLKDNSFFLNHDAAGNRNGNGAIFMDEDTSLLTRPYSVFLYGHNMKTGAMFGNLRKYEDFAYCYRHRLFSFDTLYEEGRYVIFAVETISLTPGMGRYVSLTDLQSSDRALRKQALNSLVNLSLHRGLADVNEEDQLLLLITCVGDDNERLIIAARRLRENEQTVSI